LEAQELVGFTPKVPEVLPEGYISENIVVGMNIKILKLNYAAKSSNKKIVVIEGKAGSELKTASASILGKVGDNKAEVQAPVQQAFGVLSGGGPYAGVTGLTSIRWQQDGLEYAVVGDAPLNELVKFIENFVLCKVQIPSDDINQPTKPQTEVPVDLDIEENDQKSVDAGHSPWKLDPVFVAQVFVSLKLSPGGIVGEYPIKYEELETIQNNGKEAVVQVNSKNTPIIKVYLKRLVRQDSTGIWTVTGYDAAAK
jgi:hypothetical protein